MPNMTTLRSSIPILICLYLLLTGFSPPASAAGQSALQPITMTEDYNNLSPHELFYFVDASPDGYAPAQVMDSSTIRWREADQDTVAIPKYSSIWMRFAIDIAAHEQLIVENNWNIPIKGAMLYWKSSAGVKEIAPQRTYASTFFLSLPPGQHEFYLKLDHVATRTFKPCLQIFNFHYLSARFVGKSELITFIYGMAIAILILNCGLWLFFRKAYFVYYILYSVSMLWLLAIGSFHLPNRPEGMWLLLNLLYGVATFLFVNSSLALRENSRLLARLMMAACLLLVVGITLEYFFEINSRYYVIQLVLNALALSAAFTRSIQGYRPAVFFVVGWTALFLGYAINSIGLIFHLPVVLMYSAYVGFAVELILFAFAISYKAWLAEREVILENQHAFRQLGKIFFPHQISQIKQGIELEQTMPTGVGEACVICFDIVGSSRIQHEKAKDFMQRIFHRCYELMGEGYDEASLRAGAYRIKELGDGFICSVGYPFSSPTGFMAKDALALGYRFLAVFHDEVEKLDYHEPIHCCMALAMDHISGFFPESGTKSYDIFGRAIVLATRYEAMRKVLFGQHMEHSVIILHEHVYSSLDQTQRAGFSAYPLRQKNILVRDDPSAERLFFQKVSRPDMQRAGIDQPPSGGKLLPLPRIGIIGAGSEGATPVKLDIN